MRLFLLAGVATAFFTTGSRPEAISPPRHPDVALTTVAFRVNRMEAMMAFYAEAFGVRFYEVETFGIKSQFGEVGEITLKFVPIRDSIDFVGFPVHQLGFNVHDVNAVIALAVSHGGRQEGKTTQDGTKIHAAVRDPDGNTIELYGER